ncbi:MAG: YsnF/AvaK domain-containing protein [Myxococcota bacterium]|nr:YsnF/AvaK domain-containing protein [Myxococcota bacterium]
MSIRRQPTVVDQDGVRARIREFVVDDAGTAAVLVMLANGAHVTLPAELLRPHSDGGYAIPVRWRHFALATGEVVEVPVIAEEVTVEVQRKLRDQVQIRRRVVTEQKVVETSLLEEHLDVERVPVNAWVDTMPEPRREGDTLIVPCVEEVEVVVKRLCVREELRIHLTRTRRSEQQTVTLRRHELDINRSNPIKKHKGDSS